MANFVLPQTKDPNLAFDAISLKSKIIERLNQSEVFTDQNYEGSNLAALIDIISYSFSTLLFYLNKTSSESMFSEAQLYENMNKIVKLLNYNPIGKLTNNLTFSLSASPTLSPGSYIIPRYSYIRAGDSTYSLNSDLAFTKATSGVELVADTENSHLLYQGTFEEYPVYISSGLDNEIIYLNPGKNIFVDHFNIFVYVKPNNGVWEEWKRVEDRSLYKATDKIFEVRYNPNKHYELTFGDDVNGSKLNLKDQVAIYYLNIKSDAAPVGPHSLQRSLIVPYNSVQFVEILNKTQVSFGEFLPRNSYNSLSFDNEFPSSSFSNEETTENIKSKAPRAFRSQHKLITIEDYNHFMENSFSNLIESSVCVDNNEFLKTHLRYLYNIGLKNPQLDNQVLFNQIKFGTSCNFNNVYAYAVPKIETEYLSPYQKEYILNEANKRKTVTAEIVFMDPEYMYFDFYVQDPDIKPSILDLSSCKLRIFKTFNARRSNAAIKFDVFKVLQKAFDRKFVKLGQYVNINQITTEILSIDGIRSIQTYRKNSNTSVNEVSFLIWNSKYPFNDIQTRTQTIQLEKFQFPVFKDIDKLVDRLEIVEESNAIKTAEF